MCNRSLKQTAISLSSYEAEFYAASACAGELLGLAELFKELYYKVSVRLEMDSDSARHILQRRGPAGLKHIGLQLSRGVSSFSFNMSQIVHYVDIDICTQTPSLPCRCLPCCLFFFSSSACPQTDAVQLYNTHPDSCTHMDRTGLEFHFVFAITGTVHTLILTTFMVAEPVLQDCLSIYDLRSTTLRVS